MDDLWHPERRVEEKDGPRLVQQHVLEDHGREAGHVEDDVEPGEALALELLVIHLLLAELRSPADDEKAGLESETADEVPEGWQAQILHEFTITVDGKLEVNGEEEEIPDEVQANRDGRKTLSQGLTLSDLFNHAKHGEERQDYDHRGQEGIV